MKLTKFLYGLAGIFLAVLVYYAIWKLVMGARRKSEGFTDGPASTRTEVAPAGKKQDTAHLFDKDHLPNMVLDTSTQVERPYLTNPINSLDDYEYNLVFQNEGERDLSDTQKNVLTAQYPFDWSKYPPSAAQFQAGASQMYQAKPTDPIPTDTYKAIEGASLAPPDMEATEAEERKILSTYAPKHAGDLTTYNVEDARELIHKVYDARGLIPEIVEQPNNVYEVNYTREKDEKIVYEDDPPALGAMGQTYSNPNSFEANVRVPSAATDTAAGFDPFYEPRTSMRTSKNDYTKWTPGLERMFAPTYEKTAWN
jgi:hypothetical protein